MKTLMILLLGSSPGLVFGQAKEGLSAKVEVKTTQVQEAFDHEHKAFSLMLKKMIKNGLVNYSQWSNPPEKKALEDYLGVLAKVSKKQYEKFTREEKITFWINTYNAYTIKLVLDNSVKNNKYKKIKSIKDIGGNLFSIFNKPFKKSFIPIKVISDKKLSLDDIEHEILRKEFKDKLIHFVLVCASKSCPELKSEAYSAKNLKEQMQKSAQEFLGDKSKNFYDEKAQKFNLSKIFDWYKEDFGSTEYELLKAIKEYMPKPLAEQIKEKASVKYLKYDWSLNDF